MSNPHVRNHVKLQNEMSYETRMKENTGFTVTSARYANKQKKQKEKQDKQRQRRKNKVQSIYNKK